MVWKLTLGGFASRSRFFFRVRVAVLTLILVGVLVWARRDVLARRGRNAWDHTLHVAVVLLEVAPTDPAALASIRERSLALEDRLEEEMRRYKPSAPKPFRFSFFGPIGVTVRPPVPEGEGIVALAKQSWDSWHYVRAVDERAGVKADRFDARIYLVALPPAKASRALVEGQSEQGGRVGTVEVEMGTDSADFALIVVAHELFHTLGATDKYDEQGRTLLPLGLAEPDRIPALPQRFVEVMARDRPVGPNDERPPDGLDDMAVGPVTAHEIGWSSVPFHESSR
jgi:hypothetical protein